MFLITHAAVTRQLATDNWPVYRQPGAELRHLPWDNWRLEHRHSDS